MNFLEGVNIFGDIITGNIKNNKLGSNNTNNIKNNCNSQNNSETQKQSIYNSDRLKHGLHRLQLKASKRKELARDPVRYGLISKNLRHKGSNRRSVVNLSENKCDSKNIEHFGNVSADSEFSDNSSMASSQSNISISNDPNLLINQTSKLLDNRFHERQFQNTNFNDSYSSQYDPLKYDMKSPPASANAVHRSDSGVSRLQTERNLAMNDGYSNFSNNTDLTYGVVSEDNFIHNNMIPQFKSKTYGSDILNKNSRGSMAQRKMEAFTGNMDVKITKTEQKPLFSPIVGITNIYGTPSMTNLLEDRYTPGRERKNELPFKQQRITSGLNLGYNEVNKNGDNFRAMPKTIDELRTHDKQQKSYTFSQVEGQKGSRGPVIGETKKYKPERTKYWGDDRLVPSLGYIRAPSIYGEFNKNNMATINRGLTDRTIIGPAQSEIQQATPENVREKYKVDFKQNYSQAEPRNIILVDGLQAREDERKYIPDPTQRSQTQDYVGPIGTTEVGKGVVYDPNDVTKTNMRNIHDKYDRHGVQFKDEHDKGYVINYNLAVPDMTMRDVHDKTDRYGVMTSDRTNGYAIDYKNAVPNMTMRDVHDKTDRYGIITSDRTNGYAFDNQNAIPDITMRDVHNKTDRAGIMASDRTNGYAFDSQNAIPDITMRDVHNKTDRAGVMASDRTNGYAFDSQNAIPDVNMRNIHEKTDRYGGIASDRTNGYAFDSQNAIPDINMRNIHEKTDRAGVMASDRTNGYAFDSQNAIPDINMRNIHEKTDRAGTVTGDNNKGYTINYLNMTPSMTMRDIHDKTDRSGTITGDSQKNYALDYVNATPDVTMREIHSKTDRSGTITGDAQKNYALDYVNATPDMTMREIHSKLDRSAAGANGVYLATRTRDDANNSTINIQREVIAKGRAPTNSNYSKGPVMDYTTVSLCDPIQIKRDLLSSTIAINEKLPFMLTQTPTGRTVRNTRMNEYTQQNLNENPFINNLVYKSVPN